ncbi:conjugal transfer protein [Pseudomonas syringae ICMP 13102]|uniref:Conjugal transfer protein n=3 Tax=Pseudomonas syringae group TaxID=136849 RepID=A0ABD6V5M2_9PSED|nr:MULTISPECIES: type IV secretory system conjugative DNA transfer family protein [Pseudomonas syringae group]KTB83606.1 conjugal transfer protein [Pseudomonas syringae ICMP 13102]MCF5222035.1 TraM recognition domain-containing protein [Pseudomonas syringae]MCF5243161.1 TraM recognition domain-containing protein [Pseudomonas syringae]POD63582.1 conjugal transfer protein [Pseudomonas syringae group genomosp. 3]POP91286.1 conjugal transfer protein [Pseudomonas syringae pv. syringae]
MAKAKSQPISPDNPQERIEEHPAFLLGKHPTKDVFLASYGQQFVMLAAPPGTGKGVGAVIPNLLSYPDSMVVNDPKFENWEITSGFRASAGHKVYRFSPERLETHRWNTLSAISRDPLYRLGEIRTIARVLFVSDNPKNQEWYNKAGNVFTAILLYLMETPEMPFTLPQTYEIGSLGTGIGTWAQQIIELRSIGPNALSFETLRELNGVYEASKNKSSGWSTTVDILRDVLSVYAEKTVAWAVSGDDIDFAKMREEKTTVYFSVTEGNLKKYGPLMNLFFTQAIRLNSKVIPEQGGHCPDGTLRYKYQLGLLMDELAIMGRIESMETAPALTRGAGLRFFLIFQGKDQIRDIYGENAANGIMKAIHNEIVFAPGDIKLAEEYSRRLGNTTVRVHNQSLNRQKHQVGAQGQTDSYSEQPRALMLPQEVNELPYDKQLIFIQGTKTTPPLKILARKIFFYEEEVFKARANLPPPPLPVGDASKIDALTVPVRTIEAKVAVADAKPMQAEQRQRWNPKEKAANAVPAKPDAAQPVDEPDPEPTPVQADDTLETM